MIFDNKGRLFGKISIVDIIIVVIIIAGLGGAYYKFGKSNTVTPFTKTDKVEISFYVEDIPDYVANAIKVGDTVKDRVQNVSLGKVVDIKIGPDIVFYNNSEGQAVSSSKPGYVSVTITAEGQGIYSNAGVSLSNVDYYINKQFELRVGNANFQFPRISAIKQVKG